MFPACKTNSPSGNDQMYLLHTIDTALLQMARMLCSRVIVYWTTQDSQLTCAAAYMQLAYALSTHTLVLSPFQSCVLPL